MFGQIISSIDDLVLPLRRLFKGAGVAPYEYVDKLPFGRSMAAAEAARVAKMSPLFRYAPGGAMFGKPVAGLNRAMGTMSSSSVKMAIGLGLPAAAMAMSRATRGTKISEGAAQFGGVGGGQLGAAIGGMVGGLPGEIIGGFVGYSAGAVLGKPVQKFKEFGRNMRRLEMGGDFRDTEQIYTMRQRAAAEMGQSLLNARQYLGKEARMMHL